MQTLYLPRAHGPRVTALLLFCMVCTSARGDFLASDDLNDQVMRYSNTGGPLGNFVQAGAGGLNAPFSMAWGPDGNLYVGGGGGNQLKVFNGQNGAYLRDVPTSLEGSWFGMFFTPNGDLLGCLGNSIYRLDPLTGAVKATIGDPGLRTPGKMILAPDGKVIVGSNTGGTSAIFKLDLSNNSLAQFIPSGQIQGAFGFDYGPDGFLYAAALNQGEDVYRINPNTGQVLGIFADNTTSRAPLDVMFTPTNQLWVSGLLSGNLSRFNATSGEFELERPATGRAWDLLYVPEPSTPAILAGLIISVSSRASRRARRSAAA
jgi:DNA-binding beta-propeller fold protein YncE